MKVEPTDVPMDAGYDSDQDLMSIADNEDNYVDQANAASDVELEASSDAAIGSKRTTMNVRKYHDSSHDCVVLNCSLDNCGRP